ncbi:helix-turn-helix transcriptional regulator [Actinacidiphila oryziradicis]|uniref:Helix-turn-helix domain-containing protein n=1 Tax=Actinacidiphila oryziradicis TaxID=2571141 RepID=A0A4U0SKL3_9ACTN|nr:helix-turn-helix transcriptional regulator [Actinacidiphila oryziradicis]TKA09703.1 helix-turn-helix domain-containing protein [Actinacidiphila oryziradicis]
MNSKPELGRFLRTRRAQLRPADVGLPMFDERRRVPGLRRDELAQLAGVSESYYTRLEQGLSLNASREVLDAIARAFRLDETERRHLHDLAGAVRKGGNDRIRRPAPERITETTKRLIDAFGDTPVIVLGRRSDVLGWNRTGHALFAGHLDPRSSEQPDRRPNTARLVFRDAHTRELYADWPKKARDVVGRLRLAVGRHPDDPVLAALIGELTVHSPEFTAMWSEHRVRAWDTANYRMRHPLVGPMDVTQQAMPVPDAQGQRIVAVTAAAGSASQAALTLLAQATAPGGQSPPAGTAPDQQPIAATASAS